MLKYKIMKKEAHSLVKAMKDLSFFILHSLFIPYVSSSAVKGIMMQLEPNGKRGKWIVILLEYDMEIKPTKLVKGQGIARLMEESNCDDLGLNFLSDDVGVEGVEASEEIKMNFLSSPWYKDIIFVLRNLQAPPQMERMKARFLKLRLVKFCIMDNQPYWKDPGGILLRCLLTEEAEEVIRDFHNGDYGGHLYWKATSNKILREGLYWTIIFLMYIRRLNPVTSVRFFKESRS